MMMTHCKLHHVAPTPQHLTRMRSLKYRWTAMVMTLANYLTFCRSNHAWQKWKSYHWRTKQHLTLARRYRRMPRLDHALPTKIKRHIDYHLWGECRAEINCKTILKNQNISGNAPCGALQRPMTELGLYVFGCICPGRNDDNHAKGGGRSPS